MKDVFCENRGEGGGGVGDRLQGTGHREESEDDGERVRAGGNYGRFIRVSWLFVADHLGPIGEVRYVTIQALDAKSFDSYLRGGGVIAIQSNLRRRAMEGHA